MGKPVRILAVVCCLSLLLTLTAQTPEPVDLKVIDRIVAAEKTSQVMDIAGVLTNTHGPRLTNSPNVKAAGEYAREESLWNGSSRTFARDVQLRQRLDQRTIHYEARFRSGHFVSGVLETLDRRDQWPGHSRSCRRRSYPGRPRSHEGQAEGKVRDGPSRAARTAQPETPPSLAGFKGSPTPNSRRCPASRQRQPRRSAPQPNADLARDARSRRNSGASRARSRILRMGGERTLRSARATDRCRATYARRNNARMPSRAQVTRFYFDEGVAGMIEPGPVRNGAFFAITDTGETFPWKKDPTLSKTPPQIVSPSTDYNKLMDRIHKSSPVSCRWISRTVPNSRPNRLQRSR